MADQLLPRNGLAETLKQISSFLANRQDVAQEAHLYYRRACLAATEERYDVALIFCGKAVELDSRHFPARLLMAQIQDRGLRDLEAAIHAYRKVIALAGYDCSNPYCAAAQQALDVLVSGSVSESVKPYPPKRANRR